MNLVRFNNSHFNANQILVDELFNNFFRNDYHEGYTKNNSEAPATNIFETEKDFRIEVLLPGFKKEDVELKFEKDLLTIKAENVANDESSREGLKYAHREFGAFDFEKQFRIPKTVNNKKIGAKFENGILNIVLPKREEALEKAPVEIKIS